jgi:hypothetical protein
MIDSWQSGLLASLKTINQILAAGIAITAFSLLLYALTFNLRDRVARSFAVIMICVVGVFTTKAIGSTTSVDWELNFWLRGQWVGIIFLPAAFMNFSDALLMTTGKPSQGKRRWLIRLLYLFSLLTLFILPTYYFLGPAQVDAQPAPHLQPTLITDLFVLYYLVIMVLSWVNFVRAYRRTTTPTSRRRMRYLITSALAPALGSFPFLLYGSALAVVHPIIFWLIAMLGNLAVGTLVVTMAYTVAFFGVPWPDRVVKSRLLKWLMRGPATASLTLALTTVVRRSGALFGVPYSGLVPIMMVSTILLSEYLITLFAPLGERYLFFGKDRQDLTALRRLEDRLLTRNDLSQFLEMILAAVCDRLQAPGAYIVALTGDGLEEVITTGKTRFDSPSISNGLVEMVSKNEDLPELFRWGDDILLPLQDENIELESRVIGLLGISGVKEENPDEDQMQALRVLSQRAAMALQDRQTQTQVFESLENLTPQVDLIQRLRAAGRFNENTLLTEADPLPAQNVSQWVREALTHYWGGPKLTESPLMRFKIVQSALDEHEGNYPNALRAILREAIERIRPEGERRFTGEWILYNILEMKFLEGRKVREIAMRLAMSEADLYRKQRIAIEAVAKAILVMETQARNGSEGKVQAL